MPERSLIRTGAVCAIAGGVLAAVGNGLHPRYVNQDNVQMLRTVARFGRWEGVHALLLVAIALVVTGLAVLALTLTGERDRRLCRFALWSVLAGGAVAFVSIGIDGFGVRAMARELVAARPENQAAAFYGARSAVLLSFATFATFVIVLLGVAPVLLGLGMAWSDRYPSWLGWLGLVGGLASLAVGFAMGLRGDTDTNTYLFAAASALDTIWVIAAGVFMWRVAERAPRPVPAEAAMVETAA